MVFCCCFVCFCRVCCIFCFCYSWSFPLPYYSEIRSGNSLQLTCKFCVEGKKENWKGTWTHNFLTCFFRWSLAFVSTFLTCAHVTYFPQPFFLTHYHTAPTSHGPILPAFSNLCLLLSTLARSSSALFHSRYFLSDLNENTDINGVCSRFLSFLIQSVIAGRIL